MTKVPTRVPFAALPSGVTDVENVSGGHKHHPETLLELLRATAHELSQARGTNQVLWTIAETSIEILGLSLIHI